ncbi:MAG TPA: sigma-70 family RNA polymerase sigma factor [Caulobacteraceae bacterium]
MASRPRVPLSGAAPSTGVEPRDGDLRAWMMQYGPALRRYFLRRASSSDADDLVQDVFLSLQARGSDTRIDNVEGYLFRTAANVLGMRRRKAGWRWGSQEDLDQVDDLVDELSPERILISKQALEQVVRALADMPPRTAQAFFLYRFGNLSQEEVARRMGVSLKAVEKFLRKALRHLLDHVEPRL